MALIAATMPRMANASLYLSILALLVRSFVFVITFDKRGELLEYRYDFTVD